MKLTTKTEYALICIKYICEHLDKSPVSVSEICGVEKLPKDYVGQIFFRLRKAGIIKSVKGVCGGFNLARDPKDITFKQLVEALEGSTFEIFCSPRLRQRIVCGHFECCSVRPVWRKLKRLIDEFCNGITLDVLLQEESVLSAQFGLGSFERELLGASG